MKARIYKNLEYRLLDFFGPEEYENDTNAEIVERREFCKRIQGKVVDLVFNGKDAFEAIDNNYWLPDCTWEKVV